MSAAAVQVTVTLNWIECANCGLPFGITPDFQNRRRADHATFYCPVGHRNVYDGPSAAERLKRELEAKERALQAERQDNDRVRRQRDHYERSARTYRGHLTRVRRRVGNGVCPCCNRTFKQLAAHMQRQHPEYAVPLEAAR